VAKKKKSKASLVPRLPDRERWYALTAQFDDKDLAATPIAGAFFRGPLKDIVIVEVQRDFPQDKFGELGAWLEQHGIEAMIVQEGIRFLKIAPADETQQKVLEQHFEKASA
jgi:hypothetical protein